MWDDIYLPTNKSSVYIATGNIGVPWRGDSDSTRRDNELTEYNAGTTLINKLNPKGVIITGDASYDYQDKLNGYPYPLSDQQEKLIGFNSFISRNALFPIMGDTDYWTVNDSGGWDSGGGTDIVTAMKSAYIRLMPYLPHAKRYYSIYDEVASTEFFFLSEGKYSNWHAPDIGTIFPNDTLIGGEQYLWFEQKINSSKAKNKVVIFHNPFTSIYKHMPNNIEQYGNVSNAFYLWDLPSFGVNLIITGHDGGSYHLQRGNLHVVDASAFARSKNSYTETASIEGEVPVVPEVYGQQGFSLEYFSYFPLGEFPTNAFPTYDGGINQYYIVPKNEFFRMTCNREGIFCEFISYDPYYFDSMPGTNNGDVSPSMKVEHSFHIPANT